MPVAKWIGERILTPKPYVSKDDKPLNLQKSWPKASYNVGGGRMMSAVSEYPIRKRRGTLSSFDTSGWPDLSKRALSGFIDRAREKTTRLKYPDGFLEALERCRDGIDM